MKKEYIVILLLLLVFYFYSNKAKATPTPAPAPPTPAPEPEKPSEGGISVEEQPAQKKSWNWKYYSVKAGDTLYKICRDNLNLDKMNSYIRSIQTNFPSITTEKQFILYYAQCVAETNGFDWALADGKFSSNAKDPDTLKVKQKLTIFTPESYEVIDDKGPLFGVVQYVQGWDLLPSSNWQNSIRLANPQDLVESFKNNPPKNI
jgi:hypothetical protein